MKNVIIALFLVTAIASCKDKEMEQELQILREKNQQLVTETDEQDSLMATYMEDLNQISLNLSEIRSREQNIDLTNTDNAWDDKDATSKINEDLQVISDLMEQNRQKMAELDQKLKNSGYANSRLRKSLEKLKTEYEKQLMEKDSSIAVLTARLEDMNIQVDELNQRVESLVAYNAEKDSLIGEKDQMISQQTENMNTAWYATGSSKDLVKKNIVVKTGGFLGIGRTSELNDNLNNSAFNRIDITEVREIPLSGKKAELITAHPAGSYKLEGGDDTDSTSLVILDPDQFWNTTKYLVVRVN